MKFLAAAVQMLASDDKAANLKEADHWLRQAAAKGARVIALPEVFIWRGNKKLEREFAEPIPGPTSTAMAKLARELEVFILAGSILEALPDSTRAYNTSLLFDPAGKLLASYRKIHLFDVDLANGVSLRESDTRAHGGEVVVAETELGNMGLSVCYDLRFPELYRGLADHGAHLINRERRVPAGDGLHGVATGEEVVQHGFDADSRAADAYVVRRYLNQ